ncbi:hypothetical protein GEMRC1_010577 [Eukaryota sp. GEM-RC1]
MKGRKTQLAAVTAFDPRSAFRKPPPVNHGTTSYQPPAFSPAKHLPKLPTFTPPTSLPSLTSPRNLPSFSASSPLTTNLPTLKKRPGLPSNATPGLNTSLLSGQNWPRMLSSSP